MKFLFGADPEVFVRDSKGELVSGYGMIPGTKQDPHPVKNGAVQVDGMALEFNIKPAETMSEFLKNTNTVIQSLTNMLPEGHTLDFSPVAQFGKDFIKRQPEEATELGCEPDFDAWNGGEINPKPNTDLGFRTASGHIHIGWTEEQDVNDPSHIEACIMLSKQLDAVLATTSYLWDRDRVREEMYGKLGCFRPKHYGVEYRTLSNAWANDPDLQRIVFTLAKAAVEKLMDGKRFYEKRDPHAIRHWHTKARYDRLQYEVNLNLRYALGNTEAAKVMALINRFQQRSPHLITKAAPIVKNMYIDEPIAWAFAEDHVLPKKKKLLGAAMLAEEI